MSESGFITVHLHGHLKQHCPQPFKVKARTLRQALSALQTIEAFNPQKTQRKIPVRVDHFSTPAQLDEAWGRDEVHLRPEPGFAGAGLGDVFRVIIGVVLLVAAIFTGGLALAATGWAAAGWATAAVVAATVGNYFLMTGLQGLLYGKPTSDAPQEQKRSYFGNYQQTTQAGTAIPIIVGVHKWGGHLISFGMDVKPGNQHKVPTMSDVGGWDYFNANNREQLPVRLTWKDFSDAFN
jgi:predicted phage tail protein